MQKYTGLEIAVIGLAGQFPGANTIAQYWENLVGGVDSIATFNDDEALAEGESLDNLNHPDYVRANAFLEDKQHFDAAFFGYRPDEAAIMDPQMRAFHECCWEALEDSGYRVGNPKEKIGLFASGANNIPWILHAIGNNQEGLVDDYTASHLYDIKFLSTRIAYKFNLKGPAVFLQSACSSSLVAIHEACNSLLLGECSMALAGGINIQSHSKKGYIYQEGMIQSKDGKCKPFDSQSSGTVAGEGAGVVVLKRLAQAVTDRDHIYAIIKGSAINNDGDSKVGYTAPSVKGQEAAIRRALQVAQVQADSIRFIEAHGTATSLGDPIEIEALNRALGPIKQKSCAIGSVKSNIGHLDTAAGVAGFIKAVLALKHKQLPASLHFQSPNPKINFDNGPLYVNRELQPLAAMNHTPLRAGVSSLGIGGTNAHIVLEEAPRSAISAPSDSHQLILLSAKTQEGLQRKVEDLAAFVQKHPSLSLADMAYTLQVGRVRFEHRASLVCKDLDTLHDQLRQRQIPDSFCAQPREDRQNTIFLFPGQGAQYINMCRSLYVQMPYFKEVLDECLDMAGSHTGHDLMGILFPEPQNEVMAAKAIHETQFTQPILFAIEYALARQLMEWGIQPDMMIGHSIGEYAAACISGVLSQSDAIRLVCRRGALMGKCEKGSMLLVSAEEGQLRPFLENHTAVEVAVVNAKNAIVVAGPMKALEAFDLEVKAAGLLTRKLMTSHAFHSHMMEGILQEFEAEVAKLTIHKPQIPYLSNVSGDRVTHEELLEPSYWSKHLRNTVQFYRGTEALLKASGALLIEVGPGRTLINHVGKSESYTDAHHLINVVRSPKQQLDDYAYLLTKLGQIWGHGGNISWEAFNDQEQRSRLSLPTYPFEQQTFPVDLNLQQLLLNPLNKGTGGAAKDLREAVHISNWKQSALPVDFRQKQQTAGTYLVFSGREIFSHLIVDQLRAADKDVIEIRKGKSFNVLAEDSFELDFQSLSDWALLWKRLNALNPAVTQIIYCPTLDTVPYDISYDTLEEGLTESYLDLAYLGKSFIHDQNKTPIHLTILGNHLVEIGGEDNLNPLKAAALACAKIMPTEIGHLSSQVIDLPFPFQQEAEESRYALFSLSEIHHYTEQEFPVVAYRFGKRWKPFFDLERATPSGVHIEKGGHYLITGGFGGMGFAMAKDLIYSHGANVHLVHRSDFPARDQWSEWLKLHGAEEATSQKILELQNMISTGCMLTLHQVDVAEERQVRAFARVVKEEFGVLNGIIWAAGEVDYGGIIQHRDHDDFLKYLRSKVHGVLLFEKYFNFSTLDFLSLFSSIGNYFYQIKFGQLAYNVANEFLETYAYYIQKKTGIYAHCINWCDWYNVGMTVKTNKVIYNSDNTQLLNSKIEDGIYPREGVALFHECLTTRATAVTIYKGDIWAAMAAQQARYEEVHASGGEMKAKDIQTSVDHIELELLEFYSQFFGKKLKATDNFFELGGDSLQALTLVSRLNKRFSLNLSINDIYQFPSIGELLQNRIEGAAPQPSNVSIPTAPNKRYYKLSTEQQRMYILQLLDEQSTAYNECKVLKITGDLDLERAERAFRELIQRHEILRTAFILEQDEPRQLILDQFEFKMERLPSQDSQLSHLVEKFVRPFDLSKAPLLRVAVWSTDPALHYLILDSHHIVVDGLSKSFLVEEFKTIYDGESILDQPVLQYKDYSEWQQEKNAELDKEKKFWLDRFSELPPALELPIDFLKPAHLNEEGGLYTVVLDNRLTAQLRALAQAENTTMFTVFIALYHLFLAKITRQSDIVIGIPSTNRSLLELEHAIGMFVATVPIRNQLDTSQSLASFLAAVKNNVLACLEHQAFSPEELMEVLDLDRQGNHHPLFSTFLVFEKYKAPQVPQKGLRYEECPSGFVKARFDLALSVTEQEDTVQCNFVYSTELFKAGSVERFASYFNQLLTKLLDNLHTPVDQVDGLSTADKHQLLIEFNQTDQPLPKDKTILDLWRTQLEKHPEQTALVCDELRLSFIELDQRATGLARCISDRLGRGKAPVGLLFDPSWEMIVSILAVLKTGRAYVPLSPSAPPARNGFALQDSGADLLLVPDGAIVDSEDDHDLFDPEKILALNSLTDELLLTQQDELAVAPTDQAYIIYTSGTTGQPKGVPVSHANLLNFVCWHVDYHQLNPTDTCIQLAPYHFDGFCSNFFPTLVSGGTWVIPSEPIKSIPHELIALMIREQVTHFGALPGFYQTLIEDLANQREALKIRFVVLAGEKPSKGLLEKSETYLPAWSIHNEYGPTEATIAITHSENLSSQATNNIGKPIWNTRIYILGEGQALLPVGVTGEICVTGAGLTEGYLNSPALSKESFVPNPFEEGTVMYKTGDLGRWLPDGSIEILGRSDQQVKIRGYRIEVEVITNRISVFKGVDEAIVLLKEEDDSKLLVAFFSSQEEIDLASLKAFIGEELPNYMLPAFFVQLSGLPYTSNGKLDRKALLGLPLPSSVSYESASSEKEHLLTEIWSQVLGKSAIGITDNFFAIGGDSIRSIQICARLRTLGYALSVKDIFQHPTIKALAPQLKEADKVANQAPISGRLPLSPIQRWFFDNGIENKKQFNQSISLHFPKGLDLEVVQEVFELLQRHHDALRIGVNGVGEDRELYYQDPTDVALSCTAYDLLTEEDPETQIQSLCNKMQASFSLEKGPLMQLGLFHLKEGDRLVIIIHHLVVDGVSWRILLEDVKLLLEQKNKGETLHLPPKTDSFKSWTEGLQQYAQSAKHLQALSYWKEMEGKTGFQPIPDCVDASNTFRDRQRISFKLSRWETKQLLRQANQAFNTQISDLLLTALLLGIEEVYGLTSVLIDLESHGREAVLNDVDVNRTIGWFTSIYPVFLTNNRGSLGQVIATVKECLRAIPNNGIDFLVAKYLGQQELSPNPRISFNYLGQFDADTQDALFSLLSSTAGYDIAPEEALLYEWDFAGQIMEGQLEVNLFSSHKRFRKEKIVAFMEVYASKLRLLIDYCSSHEHVVLTPSDLTYKGLSIRQLDKLQTQFEVADVYSLTPMQEGMLFHSLLEPDTDNYFEQMSFLIEGRLNVDWVEKSMSALVQRHDVLRTNFAVEQLDRPLQVVQPNKPFKVQYVDLFEHQGDRPIKDLIKEYQGQDRAQKFDLQADTLMRLTVLQLADERFYFIWSHHHIIMDGWCMAVLVADFWKFYTQLSTGRTPDMHEVKPFSNYLSWLANRSKEKTKVFWMNYLHQYDTIISFPDKIISDARGGGFQLATEELTLEASIMRNLRTISHQLGLTVNTILQAAWGILLQKYNDTDDVVFGSVVSGRGADVEGIENMIGLFINTIPVRVRSAPHDTFTTLVQQLQQQALETDQHQYYPLAEIQTQTDLGRNLINHVLVFENYPLSEELEKLEFDIGGSRSVQVREVEMFEQANYDLSLLIQPGTETQILAKYNQNKYAAATISQILRHYRFVLEQVVANVDISVAEMAILPFSDQQLLLQSFNDRSVVIDSPRNGALDLFDYWVRTSPKAIALSSSEGQMDYETLDAYANQIAGALVKRLNYRKAKVGLLLESSLERIAAILGVIKSGCAYVPLSAKWPQDRLRFMVEDSEVELVLIERLIEWDNDEQSAWVSPDQLMQVPDFKNKPTPPLQLPKPLVPSDPIYVIYTSGSTGQPKGVAVNHGNLLNYALWSKDYLDYHPGEVHIESVPFYFDGYVHVLFCSLFSGGQIILIPEERRMDIASFAQLFVDHGVNHFSMVPSFFKLLLSEFEKQEGLALRSILLAGELASSTLLEQCERQLPQVSIINGYGPTETTIGCAYNAALTKDCPNNIGKPIWNTKLYVLGKSQQLLPIGVAGELCVSGMGVTEGYINNAELTQTKFVEDPFENGKRMYKTGDLVRWLPSGELQILGRMDEQVKIRGNRVELGGVASQLTAYEEIEDVAVMVRKRRSFSYLVAYYIADKHLEPAVLKDFMADRVPDYMIPDYFVRLESFPLNANGKLDKKTLPAPAVDSDITFEACSTSTQKQLMQIWSEVLALENSQISIRANFFDLGGHSISLMQLTNRINEHFGTQISVAEMFRLPTIISIENYLEHKGTNLEKMNEQLEVAHQEASENLDLLADLINN